MENNYYQRKIFLAQADENDNIIQPVERWQAHEKGILHRGFTAVLKFENKIFLQHRRHPAFDGYWDLTFSSHQIYKDGILQPDREAIYEALEREWDLKCKEVADFIRLGKIYYKAKDPQSIYTEHEYDYIYSVVLKISPKPNPKYAYGCDAIDAGDIKNSLTGYKLTPWVEKMVNTFKIL